MFVVHRVMTNWSPKNSLCWFDSHLWLATTILTYGWQQWPRAHSRLQRWTGFARGSAHPACVKLSLFHHRCHDCLSRKNSASLSASSTKTPSRPFLEKGAIVKLAKVNSSNSLSKAKVFQGFQDEPSLVFPFFSIVENEPGLFKYVILDVFGGTSTN